MTVSLISWEKKEKKKKKKRCYKKGTVIYLLFDLLTLKLPEDAVYI